jgi:predicted alpha/beta hydrolase family esterase
MTVLVLPGLHGSGPDHWQSAWLEDIEEAELVEQRDWSRPDRDAWIGTAIAAIRAHPGALLVGHSLGAILIAHLAAEHPDLPIGGALLVAPADVDVARDRFVAGFAPLPSRPFPFPSILAASRNDPWMSFERARILARIWESGLVDLGFTGHVNAESGLGRWEEGRRLLARIDRVRLPAPRMRHRPPLRPVAAAI